jgi:hypothetical protein
MARMTKQQKLEALAAELGFTLVAKVVEAPKMVERETIFGTKFMEAEDTPFYASPRSESYWCN